MPQLKSLEHITTKVSIIDRSKKDDLFSFKIVIINRGKTPAYMHNYFYATMVVQEISSRNFNENLLGPIKNQQIIGAGDSISLQFINNKVLFSNIKTDIFPDNGRFFIFYRINYKDIFSNYHYIKGCHYYNQKENAMLTYENFNDAN